MLAAQILPLTSEGGAQVGRRQRSGIAPVSDRGCVVAVEAGRARHDQRDRVGILDRQRIACGLDPPALDRCPDPDLEAHSAIAGVAHRIVLGEVAGVDVRRGAAAQHDRRAVEGGFVAELTTQARGEAQRTGAIGREVHHQHASWKTGDGLPRVVNITDPEAGGGDRVPQIERPPVVRADVAMLEREHEVAHRQVGLGIRALQSLGERVGFDEPAFCDRAAHLRQRLARRRVVGVGRTARPQRVVVQLQPLRADAAEDHRPEPSAANRQRLDPFLRRAGVLQDERGWRRRRQLPGCADPQVAGERQRGGGGQQVLDERAAIE